MPVDFFSILKFSTGSLEIENSLIFFFFFRYSRITQLRLIRQPCLECVEVGNKRAPQRSNVTQERTLNYFAHMDF